MVNYQIRKKLPELILAVVVPVGVAAVVLPLEPNRNLFNTTSYSSASSSLASSSSSTSSSRVRKNREARALSKNSRLPA